MHIHQLQPSDREGLKTLREQDLAVEVLRGLEEVVGRNYLRQILEKLIYDLSCKFDSVRNLKIPEDPSELDIRELGAEAREEFLLALIDTLGFLGRQKLRKEFMKRLREMEDDKHS